MSEDKQPHRQNTGESKQKCLHKWFWEDFNIHPSESLQSCTHNTKDAKHSFWEELTHKVQELGKTAGHGAGTLHHWFWKDFKLSPRERGAHSHDTQRDTWCWEECLVTAGEVSENSD